MRQLPSDSQHMRPLLPRRELVPPVPGRGGGCPISRPLAALSSPAACVSFRAPSPHPRPSRPARTAPRPTRGALPLFVTQRHFLSETPLFVSLPARAGPALTSATPAPGARPPAGPRRPRALPPSRGQDEAGLCHALARRARHHRPVPPGEGDRRHHHLSPADGGDAGGRRPVDDVDELAAPS